jgi:hypothetical protein
MFEIYLIANVEIERTFMGLGPGVYAAPRSPFKIGYASDPLSRLSQLRSASATNLMLVGVVQGFANEEDARVAEGMLLSFLRLHMGAARGEWFEGDPMKAWELAFTGLEDALLLNDRMMFDLNRAPLKPFPREGWDGVSDAFHDYLANRRASNARQTAASVEDEAGQGVEA